jgi:hypothetical protein
MVIKDGEIV